MAQYIAQWVKKTTKHLDDISMAFFVVVKFSLLFQKVVCCL